MTVISANVFLAVAGIVAASVQSAAAATTLEPNFYVRTWGLEGTAEEISDETACLEGKVQSPVNINPDFRSLKQLPGELVANMSFPTIKNVYISNTGHGIQMNWDASSAFDITDKTSFPRIPAGGKAIRDVIEHPDTPVDRMLTMVPEQMHWHLTSEHAWDGMLGAAEAHIVTYVAEGDATDWGCDVVYKDSDEITDEESTRHLENCVAVFGIIFRLVDDEEAATDDFFVPLEETASDFLDDTGEGNTFPDSVVDLDLLMPEDRSYFTYIGSLTTPPCTEGLRWHVFNEHLPMSRKVFTAMELHTAHTAAAPGEPEVLYRHNNRDIQPFGEGRTMYFSNSGSAKMPGIGGDTCYATENYQSKRHAPSHGSYGDDDGEEHNGEHGKQDGEHVKKQDGGRGFKMEDKE